MNVSDMLAELRKPVEPMYIKTKDSGGTKVSYIPWYNAVTLADARLGGCWDHELVEHWTEDAQRGSTTKGYTATPLAHVRVRVTVFGDDRQISREAVGVDDEPMGQRGTPLERAEAAGLRRALAKFGLGLHLYGGGVVEERSYTQAPSRTRTEANGAPPKAAAKPAPPPATTHTDSADLWAVDPSVAGPADDQVADMIMAIGACQTEAELTKLGKEIKSMAPSQQTLLRGPYAEALGIIRQALMVA